VQRRRFLQVSTASFAGLGLAACTEDGSAVPDEGQDLGTIEDVRAAIADGGGSWYVPEARAYLVEVAEEHREALAAAVAEQVRPGVEAGFVALFQKCPHLGCRVPFCAESGWFECPCHGSRYTPYGEVRRGPADEGMGYFALAVDGDVLRLLPGSVDGIEEGEPVIDVEASGPHCV
jgi:cytochrome b6-f complex iron-sulfur subunit